MLSREIRKRGKEEDKKNIGEKIVREEKKGVGGDGGRKEWKQEIREN